MGSDSSNARDALRDRADASKEAEGAAVSGSGEMQSGKTPQGRSSESAPPADPDDTGRALLAELTVGSMVDGKYRVDAVLGRGAMGVVVAATHEQLGERVALKFLRYHPKPGATDDFQSRFKREARVSARLKNEHITRVIDVGVWRERVPYMVMDYLTGTDLREVLKATPMLPVGTALDYIVQICEGIAEAHANGVVHRDLKPSNLFLTKRPDGSDLVKILDFGISKWSAGEAELDELTQTGVVLGSPKYMAPEQLFGSAEVDARADVWSIGAILYQMLSGRPPFDLPTFTKICAELATDRMPPSLKAKVPDVSPELEAVIMHCFVRAPEHRIQNVAELAGGLLDAVQAPFSQGVRARIAATLGARTGKDALASSGPMSLSTSGSFGPILTQSGTGRAVVPVTSPVPPSMETMASPTSISASNLAQDRRRWGVWIGVGAVLLLGGAGVFAMAGRGDDKTPSQATSSAGAMATPPTTATAAQTAAPTATATGPDTATASASTASTETRPPPVVNRGVWRPAPGRAHPAPTAAPPPATTAAPPATTQPVATTPPPATTKSDPLGDRQ